MQHSNMCMYLYRETTLHAHFNLRYCKEPSSCKSHLIRIDVVLLEVSFICNLCPFTELHSQHTRSGDIPVDLGGLRSHDSDFTNLITHQDVNVCIPYYKIHTHTTHTHTTHTHTHTHTHNTHTHTTHTHTHNTHTQSVQPSTAEKRGCKRKGLTDSGKLEMSEHGSESFLVVSFTAEVQLHGEVLPHLV